MFLGSVGVLLRLSALYHGCSSLLGNFCPSLVFGQFLRATEPSRYLLNCLFWSVSLSWMWGFFDSLMWRAFLWPSSINWSLVFSKWGNQLSSISLVLSFHALKTEFVLDSVNVRRTFCFYTHRSTSFWCPPDSTSFISRQAAGSGALFSYAFIYFCVESLQMSLQLPATKVETLMIAAQESGKRQVQSLYVDVCLKATYIFLSF